MADAAVTARYAAKTLMLELLTKHELPSTATGQYNVESATRWIAAMERDLREFYVPGGSRNNDGVLQLCNAGSDLANIKSTDIHTVASVLQHHKDLASRKTLASTTGTTYQPEITTRTDANDEAERINTRVQTVIGVKEAIAEAITKTFGKHVTNAVLRTADATDFKSVNDWQVEQLLEAVRQGADRPTTTDVHAQLRRVIDFTFNFQHKVQQNYDNLHANAGKLKAVGITIEPSLLGFILIHQIELAQKHEWGRDFRTAIQTIRKTYPYNTVHDSTSINAMLAELAGADAVRNLSDAPANLPEHAAAVDLISQLLHGSAADYADDSTVEQAAGVHSDSESSVDTRRSSRREDKRNNRGRSASRNRSNSRNGRRNNRDGSLECKHCEKVGRRPNHFGISEDKCFLNPKKKGWRPEWACERLGVTYVTRSHFKEKDERTE